MNCLQVIGPVASIPFPSKEIKKSTSVFFSRRFILPWRWLWLGDYNCVPKESCDLTGDRYTLRLTDTFVYRGQVRFRSPSSLFAFDTIAFTWLSHESVLVPRWFHARSFSFSRMLELRVVKGVIISEGLLFTFDYKDFAFRGVKLDVVITRPFVYIR